jgi:hypothetical protein
LFTHEIKAAHFTPSAGWENPVLIESMSGNAQWPKVAVDDIGNAIAVWEHDYDIYANRYVQGRGWGTPELIETNPNAASLPQLAVDRSGNAVVVWAQLNGTIPCLNSNFFVPELGWTGVEIVVSNLDVHYPPMQKVVFSSIGTAYTVWEQFDGSYSSIYANRYSQTSGWGMPVLLESNPSDASNPQIASDNHDDVFAVWA